ncbi:hypothetical protein Tco_1067189 [Tanacetum coccineum]|uniref:Retroviral polymerase SH3-like domain-containing protein n=1 Tax=Tanacetum coccineum TaxID=301880 RepID=A0ABQ5HC63_9ASTR
MINLLQFLVMEDLVQEILRYNKGLLRSKVSITIFSRLVNSVMRIWRLHGTDLYTISLQETISSTPICLMAKASLTQAWLWHRRTTISTLGIHQLDFNERMLYWFTLTESKGYRVYNKRTRLVVESINLIFDEIKEMSETSVANNTSDLIPQQQKASDYDYLTLAPYTKLFLL